jgi:hypothetical protein
MYQAIDYVNEQPDRAIHRHPGGFWAKENWTRLDGHFGTKTIEALVIRKILKYTAWQEGRNGKFPVKAEMIPYAERI